MVDVAFELKPPRLVNLKLARVNWKTGEDLGTFFSVRYHDIESVVDFLLLRQVYDISMRRQWNAGDR